MIPAVPTRAAATITLAAARAEWDAALAAAQTATAALVVERGGRP